MMAVLGVLLILALIGGALLLPGFVQGLRSPGFRELDRGTVDLPVSNLVIDEIATSHLDCGLKKGPRRTKAA